MINKQKIKWVKTDLWEWTKHMFKHMNQKLIKQISLSSIGAVFSPSNLFTIATTKFKIIHTKDTLTLRVKVSLWENNDVFWLTERVGENAFRDTTVLEGFVRLTDAPVVLGEKPQPLYTPYLKTNTGSHRQTTATTIVLCYPQKNLNLFCHLGSDVPWGSAKLYLSFISCVPILVLPLFLSLAFRVLFCHVVLSGED